MVRFWLFVSLSISKLNVVCSYSCCYAKRETCKANTNVLRHSAYRGVHGISLKLREICPFSSISNEFSVIFFDSVDLICLNFIFTIAFKFLVRWFLVDWITRTERDVRQFDFFLSFSRFSLLRRMNKNIDEYWNVLIIMNRWKPLSSWITKTSERIEITGGRTLDFNCSWKVKHKIRYRVSTSPLFAKPPYWHWLSLPRKLVGKADDRTYIHIYTDWIRKRNNKENEQRKSWINSALCAKWNS